MSLKTAETKITLPVNLGQTVLAKDDEEREVTCKVVSFAITCNKYGDWIRTFRVRKITTKKNPWWGDYSFDSALHLMSSTEVPLEIVVPVKIGDTVMAINKYEKYVKCTVVSISITCNKYGHWIKTLRVREITDDKNPWWCDYSFDDFGKTVFR